jgi:hypothetical protein
MAAMPFWKLCASTPELLMRTMPMRYLTIAMAGPAGSVDFAVIQ